MSQPIKPKRRLVDLSVTLDNNPSTDPPPLLPKIDYMDHQQGWPEMAAMFPGLQLDQMPGNESWAAERLHITTHSGCLLYTSPSPRDS